MSTSKDDCAKAEPAARRDDPVSSSERPHATWDAEEAALDDEDATKLAPLASAAAATAAEVAHSSEVQRAASIMRPRESRTDVYEAEETVTSRGKMPVLADDEADADEAPDAAVADEDEATRVSRAHRSVPNLDFDEPPPREMTALMANAPGRVAASVNVPAAFPRAGAATGSESGLRMHAPAFRPDERPSMGGQHVLGHAPTAPAFGTYPMGPPPMTTTQPGQPPPTRWWILVAVFAVVAISVPLAVYYALAEDAPAEQAPAR